MDMSKDLGKLHSQLVSDIKMSPTIKIKEYDDTLYILHFLQAKHTSYASEEFT